MQHDNESVIYWRERARTAEQQLYRLQERAAELALYAEQSLLKDRDLVAVVEFIVKRLDNMSESRSDG